MAAMCLNHRPPHHVLKSQYSADAIHLEEIVVTLKVTEAYSCCNKRGGWVGKGIGEGGVELGAKRRRKH